MLGQPAKSHDGTCLHCGATLTQVPGRGRLRQFCTGEEGKAYRRRMRALGFPV
ncbi:hypothetical protein G3I62_27245 [Streptomyces sp. SID14446]|uniref:hypothetical protein n=1 Tax=Streptomyces sp. SID14446 TaxID=2706072 RepID=UPI0013B62C37|nr:hypothetical protein [Streptomyces sp. SID14446]NEB32745.1 hypothetical protein [Streptomyces sp. SID14446]